MSQLIWLMFPVKVISSWQNCSLMDVNTLALDILFLQVACHPAMTSDTMTWRRHHRLYFESLSFTLPIIDLGSNRMWFSPRNWAWRNFGLSVSRDVAGRLELLSCWKSTKTYEIPCCSARGETGSRHSTYTCVPTILPRSLNSFRKLHKLSHQQMRASSPLCIKCIDLSERIFLCYGAAY